MQQTSNATPLPTAITGNPYIAGNPVGHSDAFIGRKDVLNRAMHMLHSPEEKALVLHGQRRIGKTSILQYLQRQLAQSENFHPVYFDLQSQAGRTMPEILADLLVVIRHALSLESADNAVTLTELFGTLPANTQLVLLMDEVDVMRSHPPEGFTRFLQSLLADFADHVKLVLVIGHGIEEQGSALQNFLHTLPASRLSLLSQDEVTSLVKLSELNNTLHWSDVAVESIWQQANGHPLLTQQLCAHVWEAAHDKHHDAPPAVAATDITLAGDDVLEACHNMLEWLWSGLSLQEKLTAALMADMETNNLSQATLSESLKERLKPHQSPLAVPNSLQTRDLTETSDNGKTYYLRGTLLRRWIAEHKPFRRIQAEFERCAT